MSETSKRKAATKTGFTPSSKKSKVEITPEIEDQATESVRYLFASDGENQVELEIKGEPELEEIETMDNQTEGIVELQVFCGRNAQEGLSREQWSSAWDQIENLNEEREDKGLKTFKIFGKGFNKANGGYGFLKVKFEDEAEIKKLVARLRLDNKELRAWSRGEKPSSPVLTFRVGGALAKRADEIIWARIKRDNEFLGNGLILSVTSDGPGKPKRFRIKPDATLLEELRSKIECEDKKIWAGTLQTYFEVYND